MGAPSLAILDALQTLLQGVFDAAQDRVGAPMTVYQRSLSASATTLFPICRVFLVEENVEVQTGVSRSNDPDGQRPDIYGFWLEYRPVAASGIPVDDIETQMYGDSWIIQNTVTAAKNGNLGGLVTELGMYCRTRYVTGKTTGNYGSDAGSTVLIAEGRIAVRKRILNRDYASNA